jgi:hypothetical protein
MKTILCALCVLLWLPSRAATVTGTIQNATGTGYAARLNFVPLSNPQVLTNNLLTGETINKTCAANGTFTIVLQQGDYRVQVDNRDRFLISVPNDTNTYQLPALITQTLIYQYKFPYLPTNLNGYTNSITNLNTISASNGIFSLSLRVPRLTATQRDAYTATNGLVILNTTTGALNFYDGTNWVVLGTGEGSVTSVGITVPSWLSVSGSPVTTAGILALSATDGLTANQVLATPDGATGPVGPRALVAADIPTLDAAKIGSGTIATARLGSGTAASTTVLLGSQAYAQIADAQIGSSAAIAKSKISTSGTWPTADIPDLDASKITTGTIATARLGSGTANSTTVLLGSQAYAQIADAQIGSSAAIAKSKISTSGTWPTADIPDLDASKITTGTIATARLGSGTANSTTVLLGSQAYAQIADAQVSSSAAIGWSKLDKTGSSLADLATRSASDLASGTVAAARLGTIQTTSDGGSHSLKTKQFLVLAFPHTCDGVGAIIATNDNTQKFFGQALFSGSAAATANYIEYRIAVPEDIDTSVDLKIERWKFRLAAADTNGHSYVITMASVADSAAYDSPTLGQSVTLTFSGDASGASGDVETVSNVTLTNWKSNVTAGQFWVIRLARNGDTDASTQASYSGPLIISYGSTQ